MKWVKLGALALLLFLISGCSEGEKLLQRANELLAEESEMTEAVEVPETSKTASLETEDIGEDPATMFGDEDRMSSDTETEVETKKGDYTDIGIPNGFLLPTYEDWKLVEIYDDGEESTWWEGKFCFEEDPHNVIWRYEKELMDWGLDVKGWSVMGGSDDLYHLRFNGTFGYELIDGQTLFFKDSVTNNCAVTRFQISY